MRALGPGLAPGEVGDLSTRLGHLLLRPRRPNQGVGRTPSFALRPARTASALSSPERTQSATPTPR